MDHKKMERSWRALIYDIPSEYSVRSAIERYGVNTLDCYGESIFKSICTGRYTRFPSELVDIVFEYSPAIPIIIKWGIKVIPSYIVYNTRVLEKFIEQDVDHVIDRFCCYHSDQTWYINLLDFVRQRNNMRLMFGSIYGKERLMLHNHMQRGTTFFELMKHKLLN